MKRGPASVAAEDKPPLTQKSGKAKKATRLLGRLTANILLMASSSGATLLLIEMTARVLGLTVPFFLHPAPANCMQRSRLLSLEFRPSCVGVLANTPLRTNSLGLRGPEVRDDDSRRILALGDSCTWGWRVEEQQSYPAVLQQLLDERYGTGSYQVINAGFPGNTSYQGLRYLRERGLALRPWLVIADYGFNDITRSGDVAALIAQQARYMPVLELDDYLLDNSRTYKWLRWHIAGGQTPKLRAHRVDPERYAIYMTSIVELAAEQGAKTIFLDFLQRGDPYKKAMADIAAAKGMPLITYQGPRLDLVHPTAEGYRALALEIVDNLARASSDHADGL